MMKGKLGLLGHHPSLYEIHVMNNAMFYGCGSSQDTRDHISYTSWSVYSYCETLAVYRVAASEHSHPGRPFWLAPSVCLGVAFWVDLDCLKKASSLDSLWEKQAFPRPTNQLVEVEFRS